MKRIITLIFVIVISLYSLAYGQQYVKDLVVTGSSSIWTDARAFTVLSEAFSAIGADEQDVYILEEETFFGSVPCNVRLHFYGDGKLVCPVGQTTTICSPDNIIADAHQDVLTGPGTYVFTTPSLNLLPTWAGTNGVSIAEFSDDETMSGMSTTEVPTERAVKVYVDTHSQLYTAGGTLLELNGAEFRVKEGALVDGMVCKYVSTTGLVCSYTDQDTQYTASGTLLDLTGTAFSVNEGTMTNNRYCRYVAGTGLVCDSVGVGFPYFASGTLLDLTGYSFSVNEGTLTNDMYCKYIAGTGLVCNDPGTGGGAPVGSQYLTLAADGTLTNERVLTASPPAVLTDFGAGNALNVSIQANTDTQAGYVTSGGGSPSMVWKTDGAGVPGWRADSTGGAPSFDAIASGTNITAAMLVGTGATLGYTGTGTIDATAYKGNTTVTAAEFGNLANSTAFVERYYVVEPAEPNQSVAGAGRSLFDILTTIGTSNSATVYFTRNSKNPAVTVNYTFTSSYDMSAYTNVNFVFERGARLNVSPGMTVTLPNPKNIVTTRNQIFNTTGTVTWGIPGTIYPEWFGANPNDAVDDYTAISKCLIAHSTVVFDRGTYRSSTALTFSGAGIRFHGAGTNETIVLFTGASSNGFVITSTDAYDNVEFKDMSICGSNNNALNTTKGISYTSTVAGGIGLVVERIDVRGDDLTKFWNYGIYLDNAYYTQIVGSYIMGKGADYNAALCGIYVTGIATGLTVRDCVITYYQNGIKQYGGEFEGVIIDNVTIVGGDYGIWQEKPGLDIEPAFTVTNSHMDIRLRGITIFSAHWIYLAGNTIIGNIDYGTATGVWLGPLVQMGAITGNVIGFFGTDLVDFSTCIRVDGASINVSNNTCNSILSEQARAVGVWITGNHSTVIGNSFRNYNAPGSAPPGTCVYNTGVGNQVGYNAYGTGF